MIQNIFLLDGLGGTGKSDFIKYVSKKYLGSPRGASITKITTRPKRDEELGKKINLDLQFVTPATFVKHQKHGDLYTYDFGGYLFGFHKAEIQKRLNQKIKNIFIIVKEKEIHRRIKMDFPRCRIIRVYIYSDRDEIRKRLQADGYTEEDITFRLNRISGSWFDYLEQTETYDDIIINSSNREHFHKLIDNLITKYEGYPIDSFCIDNVDTFPLIPSLMGFKDAMLHRIGKQDFRHNVFLMMKFRSKNATLYKHIMNKLSSEGLNCVRADQKEWDITKNVYNPIAVLYCCKFGIALFDEAEQGNAYSPNVAYELAIMHLQRKNCLILKHKELPTLPFDLIKDLYFEYADEGEAIDLVEKWIDKIKMEDELRP